MAVGQRMTKACFLMSRKDEYSEEMCVAQDAAIEKAKQSRGIHM